MTTTTVIAAFKTLLSGLSPASGAAVNTYAIPADVNTTNSGGLSFDRFPVAMAMQRLGNDTDTANIEQMGSGCYSHNYGVELWIALNSTDNINPDISGGKKSVLVAHAPYESKAQEWLIAIHTAVAADQTVGSTCRINGENIIDDYRIGYLPIESPRLFGLWVSISVSEDL